MKKFYITMAAMLCGVAAMAQNKLTAEPVKVANGEEATIVIGLQNEEPISGIAFKLELPEGVTAPKKGDFTVITDRVDVETARIAADDDELEAEDVYAFRVTKGLYSVAAEGGSGYTADGVWHPVAFTGNEGPVFSFTLKTSGLEDGAYAVRLVSVSLPNGEKIAKSVATEKEVEVELTVGKGDGIFNINADDVNAPIYNVAGQRVSKAQKGVFIQNGKKVAVK